MDKYESEETPGTETLVIPIRKFNGRWESFFNGEEELGRFEIRDVGAEVRVRRLPSGGEQTATVDTSISPFTISFRYPLGGTSWRLYDGKLFVAIDPAGSAPQRGVICGRFTDVTIEMLEGQAEPVLTVRDSGDWTATRPPIT